MNKQVSKLRLTDSTFNWEIFVKKVAVAIILCCILIYLGPTVGLIVEPLQGVIVSLITAIAGDIQSWLGIKQETLVAGVTYLEQPDDKEG